MALTDKLKAIADAVRGKTGTTAEMTLDRMASEISRLGKPEGELATVTLTMTGTANGTQSKHWHAIYKPDESNTYYKNVTASMTSTATLTHLRVGDTIAIFGVGFSGASLYTSVTGGSKVSKSSGGVLNSTTMRYEVDLITITSPNCTIRCN